MTFGAARLLSVPVHGEVVDAERTLGPSLPARVSPRRTDQVDAVALAGDDDVTRADVARVDQVLGRCHALGGQRVVDGTGAGRLMHVGRRRLAVDDQARQALVTGFGYVHDPNAIDAIGFTMSVAFAWPAIAKPRRLRSRPS